MAKSLGQVHATTRFILRRQHETNGLAKPHLTQCAISPHKYIC